MSVSQSDLCRLVADIRNQLRKNSPKPKVSPSTGPQARVTETLREGEPHCWVSWFSPVTPHRIAQPDVRRMAAFFFKSVRIFLSFLVRKMRSCSSCEVQQTPLDSAKEFENP